MHENSSLSHNVGVLKVGSLSINYLNHLSMNLIRSSQNLFTPATYWHDVQENRYKRESTFLAIINNENEINQSYIDNLRSLNKLVLVKYADDAGVVPNESTWFGYLSEDRRIIPLEEMDIFKQDRLGLKAMKESGQLLLMTSPLGHLKLDEAWFIQSVVPLLREI